MADHLLLHCVTEFVSHCGMWAMMFSLPGMMWVIPAPVMNFWDTEKGLWVPRRCYLNGPRFLIVFGRYEKDKERYIMFWVGLFAFVKV